MPEREILARKAIPFPAAHPTKGTQARHLGAWGILAWLLASAWASLPAGATAQARSGGSLEDAPWWDPDWTRRLIVYVQPDQPVRDVPIHLGLNRETVPDLDWENGAPDIRFVYFDQGSQQHVVLPYWLTTRRITHGAWFACCYTNDYDQYHTPAATYYTCHRPMAVRYVGTHDRTYFVYGDFSRDPVVRYLDHTTGELSPAAVPGPTPRPTDAHGNPSLLVDRSGYLYVFYGPHGTTVMMQRSMWPEDIQEWRDPVEVVHEATYPEPFLLDENTIILTYRRDASTYTRPWTYVISTDRGETWSQPRDIVSDPGNAIYAITEVGAEEPIHSFHIALNPFHYSTRLYRNIYYAYSDDSLQTFKGRDGSQLGPLPLGLTEMDLVYDSGDSSSHVNDLVLNDSGEPFILFNVGPWDQTGEPGPGEWRVAWFADGSWHSSFVAPCDHLFDRGCLVTRGDSVVVAYLPVADDNQDGGEMLEYTSYDGGATWTLTQTITENSEYSHNYATRVRNADPGFQVMWSYGPSGRTGSSWGPDPSEVILYGADGMLSLPASGFMDAYVRLPELSGADAIYMYYGNAAVTDSSDLGSTLLSSYARLPSGDWDGRLLVEWLLDDGGGTDVTDSSPMGNDGSGPLGPSNWAQGGSPFERRYDISFPGTVLDLQGAQYVLLADPQGPAQLDQFTAELWFLSRAGGWPNGPIEPLVSTGDGALSIYLGSSSVYFHLNTGSGSGGLFHTANIAPGAWHHLAAVYDGSQMRIWLDGAESQTVYPQTGSLAWAGNSLYLGRWSNYYFEGQLDDFRFYSAALDAQEILAHYWKTTSAGIEVFLGPSEPSGIPQGAARPILAAYPNPFRRQLNIRYEVPETGPVSAGIFDVSGRLVRRLVSDPYAARGIYLARWNGLTATGDPAAAGIYFFRVKTRTHTRTARIVLVR
jgi:hypothetical protein